MDKVKKVRDSNIELFRIFLMLMIIAHHYVLHSGVTDLYSMKSPTSNQIFLELWGWGGKVGINCFLLITGYFMCKQDFTWRKFLKLYLEIKFFTLLLPVIFCAIGKQEVTFKYCFHHLFWVATCMGRTFTPSFLALFVLIPFINRLINALDQKSHLRLILISLCIYSITDSVFFNFFYEFIAWYIIVYLIGSYLRLYSFYGFCGNLKKSSWLAVIVLLLTFASILFFTYFKKDPVFSRIYIYHLVSDSNKLLAIMSAVALFCLFRSINIGQIKLINRIATATFGIYLIHDQDNVRHWLWNEVFNVKEYFHTDVLWLHAIATVLAIYVVCMIIDLLRQRFIEKPLFVWLDKKYPTLNNKVK